MYELKFIVRELYLNRAITKKKNVTAQNPIGTPLCRGLTELLCLLQDNLL